jgi:hypothetical protein
MWDGIDSNSIEAVSLDKVLDPVLELTSNPVVLLVKIWKVSESAVLNLPLISPILDVAWVVVVVGGIVRRNGAEIHTNWSDMVSNYVDHDEDTLIMAGFDEVF